MSDQAKWPPVDWPDEWLYRHGFSPASLPQKIGGLLASPPDVWPQRSSADARPPAAIAVFFIPGVTPSSPAQVVLTRRSTTVRSHKGQIGFAGGRAESFDPSPAATALRELEEELGVARGRVKALGCLKSCPALDGSLVTPVIMAAPIALADLVPSADEVAYAFGEPWPSFVRSRSEPFRFNIFGQWRSSLRYRAGEESIWGLTAVILHAADFG